MESTIIVGGNGYIGSELQNRIKADVIDIGWYGSKKCLDYNIRNYENIILLAGHSSMWMCEKDPEFSWENNVELFRRIVKDLKQDQNLIYASSASVYGSVDHRAEEIDAVAMPLKHYDLQKLTLDLIASKEILDGKNIIGLRFGTVNGLSPNTRIDLMINSMVYTAINENVVRAANIDKKRSLLFLSDLCEGMKLILNNPKPGIYNLASVDVTVGEVAGSVANILNVPVSTNHSHNNPYSFSLNCAKFIRTFGEYRFDTIENVISVLASSIDSVKVTRRDQAQ